MSQTPAALTIDPTPIGVVKIGKTTYVVRRLPIGTNTAAAGVRNQFALEGPRGAEFLVIDHGPKFRLNAFAFSRRCAPRPMHGVTRQHFAAFGVEV